MASRKIFVSYSHAQKDWVRGRLIPCLDAAGAEVLADYRKFDAALALPSQMDALVDQADVCLLVLSPEYLASSSCRREMDRAVARDPGFVNGMTLPVVRVDCPLPAKIAGPNPLYVNVVDDSLPDSWDQILATTGGNHLGPTVPEWLAVRDASEAALLDRVNVFLELQGQIAWKGLVDSVRTRVSLLKVVDLEAGATYSRRGLLESILREAGVARPVPAPPEDLVTFDLALGGLAHTCLGLLHFDRVANRHDCDGSFFDTLRNLIERRRLTLFCLSRRPYLDLIPAGHPLSKLTSLVTLRLEGRR